MMVLATMLSLTVHAQDDDSSAGNSTEDSLAAVLATNAVRQANIDRLQLSPLLGYNFNGPSSWANLAPEVFLGFDTLMLGHSFSRNNLRFRFGPTISGSNYRVDSNNIYSSLMMPGPANLSMLVYGTTLSLNQKFKLIGLAGTGLKVIGLADTIGAIAQTTFKTGIGLELMKLMMVSMQYTWAWHNITDESEARFEQAYHTAQSPVRYMSFTVEGFSQPLGMFLFFSWRKLLNDWNFESEIPSSTGRKFITIGLRKSLDMAREEPGR